MAKRLSCVVSAFGSAGDFLPTLSIAAELHAAGHAVTFVSNPFFEEKATSLGMRFVPAGERVDLWHEIETNPIYADTLRGPERILEDFGEPDSAATHQTIGALLARERVDVVVAANTSVGAIWAALEARARTALVAASPLFWMRGDAPTQFADVAIPEWALPTAARALRGLIELYLDRKLRVQAGKLGARVDEPSLGGMERAVDLHLGMWSPRVRGRRDGDLANQRVCGFTQAGHHGHPPELAPELADFLADGDPPVVVGLGSFFSLGAHDELADAAGACADLGLRCVVVGHPRKGWRPPEGTLAVAYAPYNLVFPRAALVVTHGGAGSTAEAMRAGKPVLVAPFGYDQFALSWYAERLGGGRRLQKRGRDRAAWRTAIEAVTSDGGLAERAAELGRGLRAEPDGAEVARALIEGLF